MVLITSGTSSKALRLMIILILSKYHLPQVKSQQLDAHFSFDAAHQYGWLLRELNGEKLQFSIVVEPPWTIKELDTNGTISYKGYVRDIADYVAQALNASYSFIEISAEEVRMHGSLKAALNILKTNEELVVTRPMDLLICSRIMDCSLTLLFQGFQLMDPLPKEKTRVVAPIWPFQNEVWICLPVSIVAVSLAIIFIRKYYNEKENYTENIRLESLGSRIYKAIIYLVTGEGDWTGYNQLSFRIVQGAWCLAAFVLFNAYCSTLISYLISPRLMPIAKSYEDVASGNPQELKILTEKNEFMAGQFLKATSGPFKGLGDLLRRYPESQFTDREKGFDLIASGQYAYTAVELRIAVYQQSAFEKFGDCKFIVSNKTLDWMSTLAWGFPKNWRYTNAVNFRLRGLAESGLVDYWVKRLTPKNEYCDAVNRKVFSHENGDQRKILSLNHLSGPFVLLVAGIILSIFVFILEKVYNYRKLMINLPVPISIEILEIDHLQAETNHHVEAIVELSVDDPK